MAIAFLSTLAVQIGSACFNNFRSKKHAQELARKQQAYEEKVVRDGIENARAEFAELCAFQRDMEIEMQKDRLNLIRSNHENNLIQAAYENSLGSWPLMVPPYVIKNDTILSIEQNSHKAIPLNCILTTSSDNKFNKAVFYKLEEALACFCSKYWNVSANKSIRFFQESWRDNFKDVGVKHKDLYAHLSDVPTLVISPVIKNEKLIFRFYWWGLSVDPMDAHLNDVANELDPELNITIPSNHNFSEEEIATTLSVCVPKLEAFISFFADLYYWNFYKQKPKLPELLYTQSISLGQAEISEYMSAYGNEVVKYIADSKLNNRYGDLIIGTTKDIMLNNHESKLVDDINKSILENKAYLVSSDLPLLKALSDYDSSILADLHQAISKLEKEEAITIHPFSNSDEMFYNVKYLMDYPLDDNKIFHIKFLNEFAFLACVADDNHKVLYSSPVSRYHLFVSNSKLPFTKYKRGTIDYYSKKFFQSNVNSLSPCDSTCLDNQLISKQITIVKSFLDKIESIYHTLSPVIKHSNCTIALTTTLDDVRNWILKNHTNEQEFRMALSYDKSNQVYCLIGGFSNGEEIMDDKTYISHFKYLDNSIKTILRYEYGCKLRIK